MPTIPGHNLEALEPWRRVKKGVKGTLCRLGVSKHHPNCVKSTEMKMIISVKYYFINAVLSKVNCPEVDYLNVKCSALF